MIGCDIMGLTVEQFKAFSDADQLQTIKELNNSGNVETIINILTDVGMENLSVPLLGELGRAYNNNSNEKEAIKVLESIDEEYRDAVWYYRCAYAYGALVLDNSDGYTSNTMQQMLRLVDKGVRLATEAKLDDIKSYCFEVIDMCYLQMDFETCEVDYPDVWTINEPMYWTINIYGSYDDYIESAKPFTLEQRYLNAISWYFAEVNNGGHHQFFYNSTGIVWEDALAGLRLFKMDILADNLQSVIDYFGGSVPFDREERWTILKDWDDEVFDFLDKKDDVVYEYDGIYEDTFVHEHPELFVFDGTYKVPE